MNFTTGKLENSARSMTFPHTLVGKLMEWYWKELLLIVAQLRTKDATNMTKLERNGFK